MKKFLLYIATMALAAGALTGCDDNWETPPMDAPTDAATIEPNISIADLKAKFWQDTESYGTQIGRNTDGSDIIIKGTIVSSTVSGNIYKAVYVQDSTAAICIGVDTNNINSVLPMGAAIAINVSGLTIGRYNGMMQLGQGTTSVDRIPYGTLAPHVSLDYFGGRLDTTVTTIAEIKPQIMSTAGQLEWQGKLVRFNNVMFKEAGQDFSDGSTTSRHIVDDEGNEIIVYNSAYADFAYDQMPYGHGDVVGILSCYRTSWQLLLIDANSVMDFDGEGAPEIEDGEEPELPAGALTVAEAVALVTSGQIPTETVQVLGRITSIDEVDTGSYGNATYTIMDNGGKKGLKIYHGYWINGDKFTSANQLKMGVYVLVEGMLENYNGTAELTKSKIITYYGEIDDTTGGDTPGTDVGEEPELPAGALTVAEAVDLVTSGQIPTETVQVLGRITSIDEVDTGSYGNATYTIMDNGGKKGLKIFRGFWLNGDKFTSANQLKMGVYVLVEGMLENFNGTAELTKSKIITYYGEIDDTTGGDTPGTDVPEAPTEEISVAEALDYIAKGYEGEATVRGIITAIEEVSVQYGNATYTIADVDDKSKTILVYRGYWLKGEKFTAPDQIETGAEVVVNGNLMNFGGKTPEIGTGSSIISYKGESSL